MSERETKGGDTETRTGEISLRRGDSGPAVDTLKTSLWMLGVYGVDSQPLDALGTFGAAMERAVLRFQAKVGLEPTGIADPVTLKEIQAQVGLAMIRYKLECEGLHDPRVEEFFATHAHFSADILRTLGRRMEVMPPSAEAPLQELDATGWGARLREAPYLVYALACTRGDAYYIDTAPTRVEIGGARGRIIGRQKCERGEAGVVYPYWVWVEAAKDQAAAEARARELRGWSHAWQRRLIERTNPRWICLDDQLGLPGLPDYAWRRVPETARHASEPVESDQWLMPEEIVRRDADIASSRRALATLADRAAWTGTLQALLEARLKAARWIVAVLARTRHGPFSIEVGTGRELEGIRQKIRALNQPEEEAIQQGRMMPLSLAWFEPFASHDEALARQQELRQWPPGWHRRLIEVNNPAWRNVILLMLDWPEQLGGTRIPGRETDVSS